MFILLNPSPHQLLTLDPKVRLDLSMLGGGGQVQRLTQEEIAYAPHQLQDFINSP